MGSEMCIRDSVYCATCGTESVELMHLYQPMGLARQHSAQSSLLGRMRSHALAGCLLRAAEMYLNVTYSPSACICTVPDGAKKHGTPEEIMEAWNELVCRLQLDTTSRVVCEISPQKCDTIWEEVHLILQTLCCGSLQSNRLQINIGRMQKLMAAYNDEFRKP